MQNAGTDPPRRPGHYDCLSFCSLAERVACDPADLPDMPSLREEASLSKSENTHHTAACDSLSSAPVAEHHW